MPSLRAFIPVLIGIAGALLGAEIAIGLKVLAPASVFGPLGFMVAGSAGLAGYYGALVAGEGISSRK